MSFGVDPVELAAAARQVGRGAEEAATPDLAEAIMPLLHALPGSRTASVVHQVATSWTRSTRVGRDLIARQSAGLAAAAVQYAASETNALHGLARERHTQPVLGTEQDRGASP